MMTFNHVSVEIPELKTKTINKKRFYVTPEGYYPSITTVLSNRKKEGLWEWRNVWVLMLQTMSQELRLQEAPKSTICVRTT